MNIRRTLAVTAAASLLLAAAPSAAQADVTRTGDYTVEAGKVVRGDLTVRRGTVTILGTVTGDVRQKGKGSVVVGTGGEVEGTVKESGKGSISLERGSEVGGGLEESGVGSIKIYGSVGTDPDGGYVEESGKGSVIVGKSGRVHGNVWEKNSGNVRVNRGGELAGQIIERGPGLVRVRGWVDSLSESGKGSVEIYGEVGTEAEFSGGIWEYAEGSLRIYSSARVWVSRTEERAEGDLRVDHGAHINAQVNQFGTGEVNEYGDGDALIYGRVDGDATESKAGHLYLFPTAEVGGDAIERKSGDIYVYDGAVVLGGLIQKGEGSIVYR